MRLRGDEAIGAVVLVVVVVVVGGLIVGILTDPWSQGAGP